MQELTKKIEQVLRAKFPDYTKEELDEMVQDYGHIALLETLNSSLEGLDTEDKKYKLGKLISENKTEEAFEFAASEGVDMAGIFEEISKKIVVDLFS